MPLFEVDIFLMLLPLPSGHFFCRWNKVLEPFLFCFKSAFWSVLPIALSTLLCFLGLREEALREIQL